MKKFILILIASIGISFYLSAQSAGDYRSVGNGNWNDATKWEMFDGSSWTIAATYPGQDPGTGLVMITNETEIIITAIVPNPISSLFVYAEYVCSCDNYSAPPGKLTFSSESAISLTILKNFHFRHFLRISLTQTHHSLIPPLSRTLND